MNPVDFPDTYNWEKGKDEGLNPILPPKWVPADKQDLAKLANAITQEQMTPNRDAIIEEKVAANEKADQETENSESETAIEVDEELSEEQIAAKLAAAGIEEALKKEKQDGTEIESETTTTDNPAEFEENKTAAEAVKDNAKGGVILDEKNKEEFSEGSLLKNEKQNDPDSTSLLDKETSESEKDKARGSDNDLSAAEAEGQSKGEFDGDLDKKKRKSNAELELDGNLDFDSEKQKKLKRKERFEEEARQAKLKQEALEKEKQKKREQRNEERKVAAAAETEKESSKTKVRADQKTNKEKSLSGASENEAETKIKGKFTEDEKESSFSSEKDITKKKIRMAQASDEQSKSLMAEQSTEEEKRIKREQDSEDETKLKEKSKGEDAEEIIAGSNADSNDKIRVKGATDNIDDENRVKSKAERISDEQHVKGAADNIDDEQHIKGLAEHINDKNRIRGGQEANDEINRINGEAINDELRIKGSSENAEDEKSNLNIDKITEEKNRVRNIDGLTSEENQAKTADGSNDSSVTSENQEDENDEHFKKSKKGKPPHQKSDSDDFSLEQKDQENENVIDLSAKRKGAHGKDEDLYGNKKKKRRSGEFEDAEETEKKGKFADDDLYGSKKKRRTEADEESSNKSKNTKNRNTDDDSNHFRKTKLPEQGAEVISFDSAGNNRKSNDSTQAQENNPDIDLSINDTPNLDASSAGLDSDENENNPDIDLSLTSEERKAKAQTKKRAANEKAKPMGVPQAKEAASLEEALKDIGHAQKADEILKEVKAAPPPQAKKEIEKLEKSLRQGAFKGAPIITKQEAKTIDKKEKTILEKQSLSTEPLNTLINNIKSKINTKEIPRAEIEKMNDLIVKEVTKKKVGIAIQRDIQSLRGHLEKQLAKENTPENEKKIKEIEKTIDAFQDTLIALENDQLSEETMQKFQKKSGKITAAIVINPDADFDTEVKRVAKQLEDLKEEVTTVKNQAETSIDKIENIVNKSETRSIREAKKEQEEIKEIEEQMQTKDEGFSLGMLVAHFASALGYRHQKFLKEIVLATMLARSDKVPKNAANSPAIKMLSIAKNASIPEECKKDLAMRDFFEIYKMADAYSKYPSKEPQEKGKINYTVFKQLSEIWNNGNEPLRKDIIEQALQHIDKSRSQEQFTRIYQVAKDAEADMQKLIS